MQFFLYLSDFIVPFLILAIVVYALLKGTNVYDTFIKGAHNGFLTVIQIMPTLVGLMVAVVFCAPVVSLILSPASSDNSPPALAFRESLFLLPS